MSLVGHVQQKINGECLTRTCHRGRCSLGMNDVPEPFLLIDMDHDKAPMLSKGGKKCDYIFIGDEEDAAWVAPLELKGGKFRASEVLEQLRASAKVAERMVPSGAQTEFRPILAYGRRVHRREVTYLRRSFFRFHSQEVLTVLVRCGTSLLDALKKA